MGWVTDKQMPPKILSTVMSLRVNEIAAPIQLEDGWHILKLIGTKDPGPLPFDDVKATLVQQLRAERAKANRRSLSSNKPYAGAKPHDHQRQGSPAIGGWRQQVTTRG